MCILGLVRFLVFVRLVLVALVAALALAGLGLTWPWEELDNPSLLLTRNPSSPFALVLGGLDA
eukprot:scaffold168742_cov13-Prasinocladus_malaysianus.AAC.1